MSSSDFFSNYGSRALVTGASSGIGEVFSRRLAELGFDLLLTARRMDRLEALAEELRSRHRVDVRCVPADLTEDAGIARLTDAAAGQEFGLIVLNAGSGNPGALVECDLEEEKRILRLNCQAPLELTRILLPDMIARGRGGVIMLSSLMGFQGVPYMANYSATKGYLLNLGEALHHECQGTGVDVLVVAPGATRTPGANLHPVDYDKLPLPWMSPEAVVEASLKALPHKAFVIPGRRNHLTACLSGGLWSRGLIQSIMRRVAKAVLPEP